MGTLSLVGTCIIEVASIFDEDAQTFQAELISRLEKLQSDITSIKVTPIS